MHFAWFEELLRILKPDGIMYLTTAGKSFLFKLTEKEKIRFNNGELIIRSKTKEGHRTYSAFHPEGFMQKLFSRCQVLEHIERTAKDHNTPQDIWILQK
jgi:SAM-dependent methyltransferase